MAKLNNTFGFYVLELQHNSYSIYNSYTDKAIYFDVDEETVLTFLKSNAPTHPMYKAHSLKEAMKGEGQRFEYQEYMINSSCESPYYLQISEDDCCNWGYSITDPNQLQFSFVVGRNVTKEGASTEDDIPDLPEDE